MQRIASDKEITPAKLRTAATLAMLLKGVPLIYYGQELGMRGQGRDEFRATDEKDIGNREAFEWSARVEAPGQANWYKGPKAYWTERFARDDDGISVAEEDRDPASLLGHYRKLLGIRAAHPSLRSENQRVLETRGNILAVERTGGGERTAIVANLSDKAASYAVTGRDLLSEAKVTGTLHLGPYQAAVIVR
jgi:glycosidase